VSQRSSRDLLGADGPFASIVKGYQVRSGQLEVTDAVERLLERDGLLLCEAGTGIGKTFAYLVPAIQSGRRVVISTATKTLQDQIAHRDLPLVQKALGTNVSVAVMKGLSNYLCRRRYREFQLSEEALRPMYAGPLNLLRKFSASSESGEFAELVTLNESAPIVGHVASSSDTRIGAACPYYDDCFVTRMKREAEAAQIIIVNHHLFFADLAMRGPHPGRVIPDYDAVILDEAHQVEDTAALFFGIRVTNVQVERLLKEAARLFSRSSKMGGSLDSQATSPTIAFAEQASEEFFSLIRARQRPGRSLLPHEVWEGHLEKSGHRLDNALFDFGAAARSRAVAVDDDLALKESLEQTARRAEGLREDLEQLRQRNRGRVTWTELEGEKVALSSTPVDLAEIFQRRLFEAVPAVGLLSATLSTDAGEGVSGFSFVRSRLGIDEAETVEELSVPSPFAYEKNCVLYLPKDLPRPGTDAFLDQSAARIAQMADEIDGGTFVLTTSHAAMRGLSERIRKLLSAKLLLVQGERPKEALLSAFRANGAAVLVATASFWEGIDVPGEALRLVVLEKIPFAVPTDPVFEARGLALEEAGKNAFLHLAVPLAALTLKQGFGRLIRRESDVGVVALLDERVHTKGYGKRLLRALPPASVTSDWSEVRGFVGTWARRS
jgi:ATP-dependent DNA helicase DinG